MDARGGAEAGHPGLRGLRSLQRRRPGPGERFRAHAASPPEHLMAFNPADGSTTWQDEIGASWGSIGAGGGLVVVGTNATNVLYVYDATNGTRLATLPMPDVVSSGASIVDGTIYVGYGIFGSTGGARAFGLPPPLKGY